MKELFYIFQFQFCLFLHLLYYINRIHAISTENTTSLTKPYFNQVDQYINCNLYENIRQTKFTIAYWYNLFIPLQTKCPCNLECNWVEYTSNPRHVYDSIVVFQDSDALEDGDVKRQNSKQPLTFVQMEPPSLAMSRQDYVNINKKSSKDWWGFDWKATYENNSDIILSYSILYDEKFNSFPDDVKSDKYFALYRYTTCDTRLKRDIKDLSKHFSIYTIGNCDSSSNDSAEKLFPQCLTYELNSDDYVKCFISKFKFFIIDDVYTIDNYVYKNYYLSLDVNTIPVYYGAPNIRNFQPGNHSIIYMEDYKSPKVLSDYLHQLSTDDKAYNAYFEWKSKPLEPYFRFLYYHRPEYFSCNYCLKLAKYLNVLKR